MHFSTPVPFDKPLHHITYDSQTLFLGSCFATHISAKFEYYQLRQWSNPFGVLFQPTAIERLVRRALDGPDFSTLDMVQSREQFVCFDAHSKMNRPSEAAALSHLNFALTQMRTMLTQASHIAFSLGSAWTYTHIDSGVEVANCHKIPQKHFQKWMLSPLQVRESIERMVYLIRQYNPEVKLIFTVSPVRHIKDGFIENQRSKSALILGLHDFLEAHPALNSYFPAYEILLDELRDYRFYERDMLHPSPVAIDHIWERFSHIYLTPKSLETLREAAKIRMSAAHTPFWTDSVEYRDFQQRLQQAIFAFKSQFPWADFETPD